MQHSTRALWTFGLIAVTACAAPRADVAQATFGSPTARDAASASSVRFRFLDHLSFGARIERLSLLLDGVPAFETDGASLKKDRQVTVRPGAHTLAVVLRASEPCGLFDEPRTTVAVEATTTLRAGEGPASIVIDLQGTEATNDPLRTLGVRFTGHDVLLGAALEDGPPSGCDRADALCAVDALAERARSQKDTASLSCYEAKRTEIRALRDVVDDSYATVKREGITAGAAENAQLRARYAEERIRALAVAAEACAAHGDGRPTAGVLARKVERLCPALDVTQTSFHTPSAAVVDRF
jgi:hypothetical protein